MKVQVRGRIRTSGTAPDGFPTTAVTTIGPIDGPHPGLTTVPPGGALGEPFAVYGVGLRSRGSHLIALTSAFAHGAVRVVKRAPAQR